MSFKDQVFNVGELQRAALAPLILEAVQTANSHGRSWMIDVRNHLIDKVVHLCLNELSDPIDPIVIHFSTVSWFLKSLEEENFIEFEGKNVVLTKLGKNKLQNWKLIFKEFAKGL